MYIIIKKILTYVVELLLYCVCGFRTYNIVHLERQERHKEIRKLNKVILVIFLFLVYTHTCRYMYMQALLNE